MATLLRNPALPDYFVEVPDVRVGGRAPSIERDYEAAKVLVFPGLKLDIDFDLWASLPTDTAPVFKKLKVAGDPPRVRTADPAVEAVRGPIESAATRLFEQVMPLYHQLFAPYSFAA